MFDGAWWSSVDGCWLVIWRSVVGLPSLDVGGWLLLVDSVNGMWLVVGSLWMVVIGC